MNFREFFEAKEAELIPSVPELSKKMRPVIPEPPKWAGGEIPQSRLTKLNKWGQLDPVTGFFRVASQHSLNLPRGGMPQVKNREDFAQWLIVSGILVTPVVMTPNQLVRRNFKMTNIDADEQSINSPSPTLMPAFAQSGMNINKAKRFINRNRMFAKKIIITSDNVIFDGNHHWLALKLAHPNEPVEMWKVRMPFLALDKFVKKNEYPGLTYEG